MKILIADDHAVVRRGLQEILADEFPSAEFGSVTTGASVFTTMRSTIWDVVILDINLPDRNGLEVLEELRHLYPDIPVLIMTIYPEEQYAMRALQTGARGYLTKDSAPEELVTAVNHILAGRRYVSVALAECLANHVVNPHMARQHESLSNREFQVFQLIAAGMKPSYIAEKLAISIKTVSTYRTRIFAKLELRNDSELIRYAIREGLLDF